MGEIVRRLHQHEGRRARVLEVPLPGRFGRALRDGTLLARRDTVRARQTFADWLERRQA